MSEFYEILDYDISEKLFMLKDCSGSGPSLTNKAEQALKEIRELFKFDQHEFKDAKIGYLDSQMQADIIVYKNDSSVDFKFGLPENSFFDKWR